MNNTIARSKIELHADFIKFNAVTQRVNELQRFGSRAIVEGDDQFFSGLLHQ